MAGEKRRARLGADGSGTLRPTALGLRLAAGCLVALLALVLTHAPGDLQGQDAGVARADDTVRTASEGPSFESWSEALAGLLGEHPDWEVRQAYTTDVDLDGRTELVMLVRKPGSFGTSKPFWVEDDQSALTWHVFVYRLEGQALRPVWMSSDLGADVTSMAIDDDRTLHLLLADGSTSAWRWGGWGFELLEERRVEAGGEETATLSLLVAGDNIAHAGIVAACYDPRTRAYDFNKVYDHVRSFISSYDLAAVVQETVLVKDPSAASTYPLFATPATMADALVGAGFDIVLAATNHINDRGAWAIDQTIDYWAQNFPQIVLLGVHGTSQDAERVEIVEKKGIRLAMFDYTYGLNGHGLLDGEDWRVDVLGEGELMRRIASIESDVDLTLCFLHIGQEYATEPDEQTKRLVEYLIDAGADAVVCSHPHVLQPYGRVTTKAGNSGVVFYSLGNFVAQQNDVRTTVGGMASLQISKTAGGSASIDSFDIVPTICRVEPSGETCVRLLEGYTSE